MNQNASWEDNSYFVNQEIFPRSKGKPKLVSSKKAAMLPYPELFNPIIY
jgi:hypothetical protein